MPEHDFLTAPADFTVTATPPTGMRLTGGHMTALIPGVVLEDGSLAVMNNGLTYDYDPVGLAAGVPILDVEREWPVTVAPPDVVTVSLFGEGRGELKCGSAELCCWPVPDVFVELDLDHGQNTNANGAYRLLNLPNAGTAVARPRH